MSKLPAAEVLDRLERAKNAWLATIRPDGSPHVTPVWFVYRDGTWWIGSGERNVKVANLAAEPRVSLALEDGVAPVVAEGAARIHRGAFSADLVNAFALKYGGWDVSRIEQTGGPRVLIEVPVRRWLLAGVTQ